MVIRDALAAAAALPASSPAARIRWFRDLLRWQREGSTEQVPQNASPDVTAVILSYRRPQNIRPIVRMLLRLSDIRRVIVSNNSVCTAFPERLGFSDPRVSVTQRMIDTATPHRLQIALGDDSPYFLFIDDDLFLRPRQVSSLLSFLRADPSVPHGITGQIYDPWLDRMYHNVRDHEGQADVMNGVYALTRDHVREFFRITDALRITPVHPLSTQSNWDDLVMSFSGASKPKLHRLGSFMTCPTSSARGIAASAEEGFFRFRIGFFKRLGLLKPR